jgi:hypothetical protein
MPKPASVSNAEIVKRFIDSKAVDFKAMGTLVAELGPRLAESDLGFNVVLSGRPFIIACLMPAGDIAQNIGELRNLDIGSTLGRQRG